MDTGGLWTAWDPLWAGITVGLAILYWIWAVQKPMREPRVEPAKPKQTFYFLTGLLILFLAQGSPIAALSHKVFSIHMFQQSMVYLVMPPLLLLGTPAWMLRPLFQRQGLKQVFTFLTHPLIAVFLFNGAFSLYHLPVIFDWVMTRTWAMTFSHGVLVFTAFLMWWPIVCPLPEKDRLSELQKLAYIFADGVLLTPACALLAFSDNLVYDTYAQIPQTFAFLSPLQDQKAGGVIMKIVQEVVYVFALAWTFFRWVRKERAKDEQIARQETRL